MWIPTIRVHDLSKNETSEGTRPETEVHVTEGLTFRRRNFLLNFSTLSI